MEMQIPVLMAVVGLVFGADVPYQVGVGRADVTGPSVQIEMMGYANPAQIGEGIHLRQYSRAFIIGDDNSRVVFVSADICMGTQIVKAKVVEKLQEKYGDLYNHANVLISGIHTHSGAAGYFQYVLFEVTSLGFVRQALDATVEGIVLSITRAHDNMKGASLSMGSGLLYDANINRSPTAYLNNPVEERSRYKDNVDKDMVVLKMVDDEGKDIGMIDWFAVHCTSMNNTNKLMSSDNKGVASFLMEKYMNGPDTMVGQGDFVAAFAQSNEGDVSPNTCGPHCIDTGLPCDTNHSTCNGRNEQCIAFGPGKDMVESTWIIGSKQYEKGKEIYGNATVDLAGPVGYVYQNVDFSNVTFMYKEQQVHTCPPAMGRSFAAGTTDGPGAFNFEQGDTNGSNPFWDFIRNILKKPSPEQVSCHYPKPILLDTGEMNWPYPWQSKILPLQMFRVGQLVIIGVPAEFSTMSGRRLRDSVKQAMVNAGFPSNSIMVVAGLSNTYSDYVTTFEEYQIQRYEGASTAYGPHTLGAYINKFETLGAALAKGAKVEPGPDFPDYLDKQLSFHEPIIYDSAPSGSHVGSVKTDVKSMYTVNSTVEVQFWAGNPRNNLMLEGTYLTVQIQDESSGSWKTLYTDSAWETRFKWEETSLLKGESVATITWDIPPDATPGVYRIQHFGSYKPLFESPKPYSGISSSFKVTN